MTMQRRRTGLAGEKAARDYLETKGYRIEQLNFRCHFGEMDIVAREGGSLIFVEVRSRTGRGYGSPAESLTVRKLNRLKKLALYYMQQRYGRELPCRFDLVTVKIDRVTFELTELKHYPKLELG